MIETLELPSREVVRFVYLRKFPNLGDMIYLQSVRSGLLDDSSFTAQGYRNMAPLYARHLAEALVVCGISFDAVAIPPSRRRDVEIYVHEITSRMRLPILSDGFSRKGKSSAATANSVDEIVDEFTYQPNGTEGSIRSLLIVDDLVASGKTVSALVHHLRNAGLPEECDITVAAPAWIKAPSESPEDLHP